MTSSGRDDWETPRAFFNRLDGEFGFTLDVCANADNAKCERFYTLEDDAFVQPWAPDVCWMNPPYGRGLVKWVGRACIEGQRGATVVCLLPARTDTIWFHVYALHAAEIRFLRGRLKYEGATQNAPFPNVVVVFKPWHVEVPVIGTMEA